MAHLTSSEIVILARANAIVAYENDKTMDKIRRIMNKYTDAHPELSETEIDGYREKLIKEFDILCLTGEEADLQKHVLECFYCRNIYNKMVGIDEDLIISKTI